MKVLLTGGSGTVGKKVLEKLCEYNTFETIVFDLKSKRTQSFYKPYRNKVTIIYGDISKRKEIEAACKNIDFVIHLAAIIPPLADQDPDLAFEVNVRGTEHLLRSLEMHSKDAFFIYASSVSVYGDRVDQPFIRVDDPLLPSEGDEYARTKIAAEQFVRESQLDWSIFRLSAIFGSENKEVNGLLFDMPLATPMEITTSKDTAKAFVHAIAKKEWLSKKIFNLGGGEKCRIIYGQFLSKSFPILGLGEMDFPEHSFAEKNFHCGYYEDGDELEKILHFREDTIQTYFTLLKKAVSPMNRWMTWLFRRPIKNYLLKKSEPLKAYKKQDQSLLQHYFKGSEAFS
jgi:nucleoside-diphosphate-sugar epimerase